MDKAPKGWFSVLFWDCDFSYKLMLKVDVPVRSNEVPVLVSFGSLKHDWLLKVAQPTREHMRNDVTAYMRYYNLERLHTANGDLSPVEYEQSSLRKVS